MEIEEVDCLIERYKAEIEAKLSIERHKAEIEFKLYSVRRAEYCFEQIQPTELQAGRDILQISPKLQADMIDKIGNRKDDAARSILYTLEAKLLSRKLPLTLNVVERLINRAATSNMSYGHSVAAVKHALQFVQAGGTLSPSLDAGLRELRKAAKAPLHYATNKYDIGVYQKIVADINKLLGSEACVKPDAGESWADEALLDLEAVTAEERSAWDILFTHATIAEAAKPSAKWLAEAARHKEAIGEKKLARHLISWLGLASPPPGFGGILPSGDGIIA